MLHSDIAISLKHISKRYSNGTLAVDNLSLDIPSGKVIGYIGPNGAGKSTTVKILTGLITDFEGTATVLGRDMREELNTIKSQIGYIPENAALYELLTPMEFLQFVGGLHNMPPDLVEARALSILKVFELTQAVYQRIDSLSKGMRQKVLVTAALLHDPKVIYMDEPLSGLDANSVLLMKDLVQELKRQGKTIIYCSHIMDVVEKVSDSIVLIAQGKILAQGTLEELKTMADRGSLEHVFAKLTTGHEVDHEKVNEFLNIFK